MKGDGRGVWNALGEDTYMALSVKAEGKWAFGRSQHQGKTKKIVDLEC
jgi:hypothetical protein